MAIDVEKWLSRIAEAKDKSRDWRENAKKIVDRYRGRPAEGETSSKVTLNLHWSNMQLYLATVFARTPQPEVTRRWKNQQDGEGQYLAEVVQDALRFSVDQYDFDRVMEAVLVDYGNAACGQIRVRYKPYFQTVGYDRVPVRGAEEITADGIKLKFYDPEGKPVKDSDLKTDEEGSFIDGEPIEEVAYEEICFDFVPYYRFLWDHTAKLWKEVNWAAIEHPMTKGELQKQFGAKAKDIDVPDGEKVCVWEVFDKAKRRVFFVCDKSDKVLDDLGDQFKLEEFFPFPCPLFGTTTSDSLIPVPRFQIVQDLYYELDHVQARISSLVRMLKVVGFHDPAFSDKLVDVFSKQDGYSAPVEQWAALREKGGLKGVMDFIPLEAIYGALQTLQNHRTTLISLISEIEGFADFARGGGKASTSAAAEKLKNEYMSARLNREVQKVARFIMDVLKIAAELMAEHFSPETITQITGKEMPEEVWSKLRSDVVRAYKIDVKTDSMLVDDENAEVERRASTTNGIATFMQAFAPYAQQGLLPPEVAKQIILWNAQGSNKGRELEKMLEGINFAPPPPPPPAAGQPTPA